MDVYKTIGCLLMLSLLVVSEGFGDVGVRTNPVVVEEKPEEVTKSDAKEVPKEVIVEEIPESVEAKPAEKKTEPELKPEPKPKVKSVKKPVRKKPTPKVVAKKEIPSADELPFLSMGGRIDISFFAGNTVFQGFVLPSVRLSATGFISEKLIYDFSLGQTREFTTVVLPQMLPVFAFMDFALVGDHRSDENERVSFRLGMFTPELNPWWTPDLSELSIPDYNEVHRVLLLARDLGAQMTYLSAGGAFELAVGYFNGNGIFALNSNNSRAINGYVKALFDAGDIDVNIGAGGYYFRQSSPGGASFIENYAANGFVSVESSAVYFFGDVTYAEFMDSTRLIQPFGASVGLFLSIGEGIKLFGRAEGLDKSPEGATGMSRQYQIGPVFEYLEAFTLFTLYTYRKAQSGGDNHIGEVRARLVL